MAPKADKKVKDKKGEDINLNEGPPAVQLHEEKEVIFARTKCIKNE